MSLMTTHTATHKRPTRTKGAAGGWVTTNSTVATIVGTLQPMNGRKVIEFDKAAIHITHVFYSTTEMSFQTGDYLDISGSVYQVQHWRDQGGRGRVYAAYLLEKK